MCGALQKGGSQQADKKIWELGQRAQLHEGDKMCVCVRVRTCISLPRPDCFDKQITDCVRDIRVIAGYSRSCSVHHYFIGSGQRKETENSKPYILGLLYHVAMDTVKFSHIYYSA